MYPIRELTRAMAALSGAASRSGSGRRTLYTIHRQVYRSFEQFRRRYRNRDWAVRQRAARAVATDAYLAALRRPDCPQYMRRWLKQAEQRTARR